MRVKGGKARVVSSEFFFLCCQEKKSTHGTFPNEQKNVLFYLLSSQLQLLPRPPSFFQHRHFFFQLAFHFVGKGGWGREIFLSQSAFISIGREKILIIFFLKKSWNGHAVRGKRFRHKIVVWHERASVSISHVRRGKERKEKYPLIYFKSSSRSPTVSQSGYHQANNTRLRHTYLPRGRKSFTRKKPGNCHVRVYVHIKRNLHEKTYIWKIIRYCMPMIRFSDKKRLFAYLFYTANPMQSDYESISFLLKEEREEVCRVASVV